MLASVLPISLAGSAHASTMAPSCAACLSDSSTPSLVLLAQAGDEDAFAELYLRHKKRIFLLCMRMVHDYSLAEDLAQEAFFQVHRKLASFRGESAFATWLHRLTVNTVLMHLRKRSLSLVSLDHVMSDGSDKKIGLHLGTRDVMQAGVVDRLTIERAVGTLAPGYRRIFVLHDAVGFNHGEIADMLKCTRGNTKSQLHKARQAMRRAVGSIGIDPVILMRGAIRPAPGVQA